MAVLGDNVISGVWASVGVLATNEVWQSKGNDAVSIATGAEPTDDEDGVTLTRLESIALTSGLTVWYRRYESGGDKAMLSRTAV